MPTKRKIVQSNILASLFYPESKKHLTEEGKEKEAESYHLCKMIKFKH